MWWRKKTYVLASILSNLSQRVYDIHAFFDDDDEDDDEKDGEKEEEE